MLTLRFFVLLLICPALLILSGFVPALNPLAIPVGVAIAALGWVDRRYAGPASQFSIERSHEDRLSLGVQNRIALRIRSYADRPIAYRILDEPPYEFIGFETADQRGRIAPRENIECVYHVRPLKRGNFAFGKINLRWHGPLGLYVRQGIFPSARQVKVYPNLLDIQRYDLLTRRDQLAEMGLRNVRQRGEGTAFESLRDYTPDDPYRSINWKATARAGKPISMDFEPERSQRVIVLLDVGRMMRSPLRVEDEEGASWQLSKADLAINSTLLFSYVATLKGDHVGLLVFADRVQRYIAPKGGRAHFQELLDAMYALESESTEADYGLALNYLHEHSKKRALVVLFTDLSGARAAESLIANVPRLRPRHLPLLVTIRDPGLTEEAEQIPADATTAYRRAVAEQMIDERRLLLDNLRSRGVLTLDVDARHLSMAVVNRYLELRRRM